MPARPLGRLVAALACLAVLLLPQPASSSRSRAGLAGERGSGPETWQTSAPDQSPGVAWSDVGRNHWAREAIDHVAGTHRWMRDYRATGDGYQFKPDRLETRKLFARAMLRAFAATAEADPSVSFEDVPEDDRFFRAANVAVSKGWMRADRNRFEPDEPVTPRIVHRALVFALGLRSLAAGANALHLKDGTEIRTPAGFGTLLIGMRLGLRFNHGDESLDVGPDDALSRAEVAWSLFRAAEVPSDVLDSLAPYADMSLPNLDRRMQRLVGFGVRYVGFPYVWGGEWADASPSGYCCGWQPRAGFDCSGLTWWILKRAAAGWDNTPPRTYRGWDLPQRTSAHMASIGRIRWDDIRPGDLLFYDGDGDGTVDHVNTSLGRGWALDSGSSNAGVTITRVAGTWYEGHFVHARRLMRG